MSTGSAGVGEYWRQVRVRYFDGLRPPQWSFPYSWLPTVSHTSEQQRKQSLEPICEHGEGEVGAAAASFAA